MEMAPINLVLPVDFTAEAHGFKLNMNTLSGMSPSAIAYLIRNGFTQSITDAAAFSKADKDGKTDDEIAAMAKAARSTRYQAIIAGTVATGGPRGPRKSPLAAAIHEVAVERLQKAKAFTDKTHPKYRLWSSLKAGDINALVAQLMSSPHADAVRAEAQRRVEALASIDLDI